MSCTHPAERRAIPAPPRERRPNLLFVLADQWRFSAFGHEGDPNVRTPHLDDLAQQSLRWRRAYATNPVCTPNRACLLTGRFSHQSGMIANNAMLPPAERCLPEPFDAAGYRTHYVGKWHLDGPRKPGFVRAGWRRRGFQTFEGFNRGHRYFDPFTFTDDGRLLTPRVYEPTYQTDQAIAFLSENRARPWLCFLSYGPPHSPYTPPPAFAGYRPDQLELRPNVPPDLRGSARLRRELAGYYGLCESIDHEVGRLVRALDGLGLAEDTLLVFTSDHGDLLGSHGRFTKNRPEEESLRVPLLTRLPGRISPGITEALIGGVDVMPTCLSLCDLPAPPSCAGRDLSGVALRGSSGDVASIYCEGNMDGADPGGPWRAIVTPRHKLAVGGDGEVTHLFDLREDPYELNNLAAEPAVGALRERLVADLLGWARETGDPWPAPVAAAQEVYSDEEAITARAA